MADTAVPLGAAPGRAHALPYRPDIDGLRALAVVGVILYHAKVPGFSGGYVGVDVFFVISGYLITMLLTRIPGASVGQRLAEFYVRRARRILPALLTAMAVSAAVAVWLLLPTDLERFGKFLAYSASMLANFAAWFEEDYFAGGASQLPLLHLWSIAVEEQFYLLYPFVLLLCSRLSPRGRRVAIGVIAVSSLALWSWGSIYHPRGNFYLAPGRGWEFLAGALVALGAWPLAMPRMLSEVFSLLALAAIGWVFFGFTDLTAQHGAYALLPVVAAILLVAPSAESTAVGRILSTRPLVFVGLISYSLYLWHAPILVFARYFHITPLSGWETAALIAGIFAISVVSWRYVEKPVRAGRWPRSTSRLFTLAGAASLVLIIVGLAAWRAEGWPQRFSPQLRALLTDGTFPRGARKECFSMPMAQIAAAELCQFGPTEASLPKVVLWGDSHALRLLPAFEKLANERKFQLHFAAMGACRPMIGVASPETSALTATRCEAFNAAMAKAIERLDPALVIFAAFWVTPSTNFVARPTLTIAEGDSLFSRGMQETLRRIDAGRRPVCAVLGVPTYDYEVNQALVLARRFNVSHQFLEVARADVMARHAPVDEELRALERRGLLVTADPKRRLCPDATCRYLDPAGHSLYFDSNHLSMRGAEFIFGELASCLRDLAPPAR